MIKYKILILLTYLILLYPQSIAFASEKTFLTKDELQSFSFVSFEQINPNLLIYPLKRGLEKIKFTLLPTTQKQTYMYTLFDVRFKELIYIINNKKEGFIPFTADRYNTFVGSIKSNYSPNEIQKKKIKSYLKLLERMRDIFPANSPNWEKIQQTVDTTNSLL